MRPLTRAGIAVAAALLLAFAVQCAWFVWANSPTYDEGLTLVSGELLWRGGPDVNGEHPPLARRLASLPIHLLRDPRIDLDLWHARRESPFGLGQMFLYEGGVPHSELLTLGRAPMVVLALLLVGLTGLFAWRLFGARAGLLALALVCFDPNLVAHGSIASHDGPLALFSTAALFATAEFLLRPRLVVLAVVGVLSGLALVTKFSGVLVLGGVGLALLAHAFVVGGTPVVWMDRPAPVSRLGSVVSAALNAFFALALALLVVRLAYGTRGYEPYWHGLRAQWLHQSHGHPAYFLGEVSRQGWRAYFPVAILVKAPPLLLVLAAVSLCLPKRLMAHGRAFAWPPALPIVVLVLPVALWVVALVFAKVAIGVRYALPIFPLLAVVASRVAVAAPTRPLVAALSLGLLHHASAAARIAPHSLAFFSDAIGGPARGHLYLSDSNLDWGQDLTGLAQWSRRANPAELMVAYFGTASPDAHGLTSWRPAPHSCPHPARRRDRRDEAPQTASPGAGDYLAISRMHLHGAFFPDPRAYRFLEGRRPVAELGHSIVVYDLTGDAAAYRALAELASLYGPRRICAVGARPGEKIRTKSKTLSVAVALLSCRLRCRRSPPPRSPVRAPWSCSSHRACG
ncbi:MAG: phospholipid carrier-dependent glycosyltransferase [Myxococcales bacterium]|nr:phospholipid carrier-dependent glycosyltransferase [Myxococcales bacterium]